MHGKRLAVKRGKPSAVSFVSGTCRSDNGRFAALFLENFGLYPAEYRQMAKK